jgi:hypothetical protein
MTELEERIQSFQAELRAWALEGFMEASEETKEENGIIIKYLLLELAKDMKAAVRDNDHDLYNRRETEYLKYFNKINSDIASTHYADILDHILDNNVDNLTAKRMAVESLWQDARYRHHLNAMVRMVNETTGEYLYLVADHNKAPTNEPYVTVDELPQLEASGINPWDYVNRRRMNEGLNSNVTMFARSAC